MAALTCSKVNFLVKITQESVIEMILTIFSILMTAFGYFMLIAALQQVRDNDSCKIATKSAELWCYNNNDSFRRRKISINPQ